VPSKYQLKATGNKEFFEKKHSNIGRFCFQSVRENRQLTKQLETWKRQLASFDADRSSGDQNVENHEIKFLF
jgi:hypothetical protein